MPNTLVTRPLPPAVGVLPVPVEVTLGRLLVTTVPGDALHPMEGSIRQAPVLLSAGSERQSTQAWVGYDLSRFSIALRAIKGRGSPWTRLTLGTESKLRQELLAHIHLADNWDGDGSKAPTREAVEDALTFLDSRPPDIPLPYPEAGAVGDVGLYWDYSQANVFAEVIFEGDGTCAYFAVHGVPGSVTQECGKDDVSVAAPWPADMLRILRMKDSV